MRTTWRGPRSIIAAPCRSRRVRWAKTTPRLLVKRRRPQEAEPLQRRALAIQESILGPDHPELIATIYKLALLLNTNGRVQDAEHLLYRAAAIREKVSGPDNADLADLLSNLAALLIN